MKQPTAAHREDAGDYEGAGCLDGHNDGHEWCYVALARTFTAGIAAPPVGLSL